MIKCYTGSGEKLQILIFTIASIVGYIIFYVLTHPKSKVHNRLPDIKIKWFQFFPVITLTVSGKVVHLHHWLGFSIILVFSIFVNLGFLSHLISKGVLFGGIIQGFLTPKCFQLIYKKETAESSKNT